MYVVGLTGGIGSGKTAVSDLLALQGINIVDADVVSRRVVEPGQPALARITEHFGASILLNDGTLDRAQLRQRIFSNADDKQWLESLLHPCIGAEVLRLLETAKSAYVILVSPLLIEAGQDALCDRVLIVDTTEALQVSRTTQRDDNTEEQVKRIIASQSNREQRLVKASDVINNTRDLHYLKEQTLLLHQQFLRYAADKAGE